MAWVRKYFIIISISLLSSVVVAATMQDQGASEDTKGTISLAALYSDEVALMGAPVAGSMNQPAVVQFVPKSLWLLGGLLVAVAVVARKRSYSRSK